VPLKGLKILKMANPKLKIQNIVATTSLNTKVPLVKLVRSQSNTEYNPEQFPGLVLRINKPKSAVLVFNSGNLVCTGTKSIAQVQEVIVQVIKQLKKIGVKVKGKPKINVQNIVASGEIKYILNLNEITLSLENTEYEPEQFPGLVFSNGKLVCTGTKNKKQLDEAMTQLLKNIKPLVSARKK